MATAASTMGLEDKIRKRPQPEQRQAPVVQRVRIRYAKRGRMRFTSHRDVARALERALLRANVPIAYSQGFTPHPKISYASAAPTGVATEAEYLELGLRQPVDPQELVGALDAALPAGLDVVDAVQAGAGRLADRLEASSWRISLPGVAVPAATSAVAAFLDRDEVVVERTTKRGVRSIDTRGPVVGLAVADDASAAGVAPSGVEPLPCAILAAVVRHVTPTVRPEDVLTGLRMAAGLGLTAPTFAMRMAQGLLTSEQEIIDPLAVDRGLAGAGIASG